MEKSASIMAVVEEIAMKLFKKTTLVHEFYVHKNNLKICFGVKIKKLFSAIVTIKSREKVTIVTFNLNGYKYRLYLATGKMLTAIRTTLLYIKGKVTKDAKIMRQLNAVTLKRKEYKQMKLNKKRIIKAMEKQVDAKEKKRQPAEEKVASGPLVIKFGWTGESPKFDDAASGLA